LLGSWVESRPRKPEVIDDSFIVCCGEWSAVRVVQVVWVRAVSTFGLAGQAVQTGNVLPKLTFIVKRVIGQELVSILVALDSSAVAL
jgi:hypothetical protein